MPDRNSDATPADFQLFERRSFLGWEGVLRPIHPPLLNSRLQVGLAILLAWLPLLILTALQAMVGEESRVRSFLQDAGVHARFLITVPIILLFSGRISADLRSIVEHFPRAGLIPEDQVARFTGNIASVMRLSRSRLAEWFILGLVYSVQAAFIRVTMSSRLPLSWRVVGGEGHRMPSLAGLWFAAISEPIYGLVLCRFLYRIALWWIFLWKTSRLRLQLDGAHPDCAGGIGFLGMTLSSFKEAAFAISTSFAGGLANIVSLTGYGISRYKFEVLALIMVSIGVFAGPLLFFYGSLMATRFRSTLQYWTLWQGQQRQFQRKWMRGSLEDRDMLGIQDFSEATDLSQILERVQQMGIIPVRRRQAWPLLLAATLPFAAVLTAEIPVEEMVKRLLKIAF